MLENKDLTVTHYLLKYVGTNKINNIECVQHMAKHDPDKAFRSHRPFSLNIFGEEMMVDDHMTRDAHYAPK